MDIDLTLNAQFYKLRPNVGGVEITAILEAAIENGSDEPMLADEFRVVGGASAAGADYRYSLRVFQSARPVYFLPNLALEDLIYSYILVLEMGEYVVVSKKGVGNISDELDRAAEPVSQ